MAPVGVLSIEWAEKLPSVARLKPSRSSDVVNVRIEHGDGDERIITVTSP